MKRYIALLRGIRRMLNDGGIFITEQVGAENDRELVELILGKELPFPKQYLEIAFKKRKKQSCNCWLLN